MAFFLCKDNYYNNSWELVCLFRNTLEGNQKTPKQNKEPFPVVPPIPVLTTAGGIWLQWERTTTLNRRNLKFTIFKTKATEGNQIY